MDACEYCGNYDAVEWNDEAGDICKACLATREAARLQREEEKEREEANYA